MRILEDGFKAYVEKLTPNLVDHDPHDLRQALRVYLTNLAFSTGEPKSYASPAFPLKDYLEVSDEDFRNFFEDHGYELVQVIYMASPWSADAPYVRLPRYYLFVRDDSFYAVQRIVRAHDYEFKRPDTIDVDAAGVGEAYFEVLEAFESRFRGGNLGDEDLDPEELLESLPKSTLHVLVPKRGGGYEFHPTGVEGVPLEKTNYSAAQIEGFTSACDALSAHHPDGRLVLLTGPPGTGKTYFVRGLLDAVSANFVMLPSSAVDVIAGPEMLQVFMDFKRDHGDMRKPLVVLIEDADKCLVPRASDNVGAISNMLNLCDGLLGDVLDIRVLATTNARHVDLDPAIARTGRLHTAIDFDLLDTEHARCIFDRLCPSGTEDVQFEKDRIALSDVYALAAPFMAAPAKEWKVPEGLPDTARVQLTLRFMERARAEAERADRVHDLTVARTSMPREDLASMVSDARALLARQRNRSGKRRSKKRVGF